MCLWKKWLKFAVGLYPPHANYEQPTTTSIILMDKPSLFLLTTILLSLQFFLPTEAAAQKCRIKCGRSDTGTELYKEVFEYDFVSEKPVFPGGNSKLICFINSNRHYPEEAYRKGIQGRVTCSFVINPDGSVSDVRVLKGVEASLNQEAVRIIESMPEWIPGKIDGRPVPVRVIWPVPFRK